MNASNASSPVGGRERIFRETWTPWMAGAALTLGLFLGMALLQRVEPQQSAVEIEDLPMVAMPPDVPPPVEKHTEVARTDEPVAPLTALEAGDADSPIKIAVAPPELERFLPDARSLPMVADIGRFHREYGPKKDVTLDPGHVYQQSEVDRPPRAITRIAPGLPAEVWGNAKSLRVVMLLGIDTNGRTFSARVLESSGKPVFDELVVATVTSSWLFSPAVKRSKNVKCLVEQAVRIALPDASPFSL